MLIELQNIYKIYNAGKGDKEVRALDGVSLSIEKGSYNAIVGHSGSGCLLYTSLVLPGSTYWRFWVLVNQ